MARNVARGVPAGEEPSGGNPRASGLTRYLALGASSPLHNVTRSPIVFPIPKGGVLVSTVGSRHRPHAEEAWLASLKHLGKT